MPTALPKQLHGETSSFVEILGMSVLQTFEATDNKDDILCLVDGLDGLDGLCGIDEEKTTITK
jgi:hypothetical protein